MSAQAIIDAFHLPPQALVSHRIPKKLLVEQSAPTAADKRLINDTVDELWWHAALKPCAIGVPASSGPDGEVIELALVSVQLKQDSRDAQAQRLRQLIHRAIPYPVLLVASVPTFASASNPGAVVLSLARKRASLGEAGKWVLAETAETHAFNPAHATAAENQFMSSLALDQMPRSALLDLSALYQGYADRVTALAVAQVTGQFSVTAIGATASAQRQALADRQQVLQQLSVVRSAAAKARQMNRRVELNLEIQRLQSDLQQIESQLT